MRGFRKWISASLALVLAIGAIGCTLNNGSPDSRRPFTVGITVEPASMNPILLQGTIAGMVGTLFFSFLTTDGPRGELEADAATEVPTQKNGGISPDGKHIVFRLRKGVVFSDGTPLTARDCVFTYRAIMNPRTTVPSRFPYDDIVTVSALDPYTIAVTFKHRSRQNVGFLSVDNNYPILPAHLLEHFASLDKVDFNTMPVGSGPFRLVKWSHGDQLLAEANPRYFRGSPKLKRLRVRFVADQATLVNQLRTRELDAGFGIEPSQIEAGPIAGMRTVLTDAVGMGTIMLNTASVPTSDPSVRQAIAMAIDVPSTVRRAGLELYRPGNARRRILGLEAADLQAPPYDQAHASQILDEAGWRRAPGGIRMNAGHRLEIQLVSSDKMPQAQRVCVLVAEQLRAIGVDASIRIYPSSLFSAANGPWFKGAFSAAYVSIVTSANGDLSWLYRCNQAPPHGFNLTRTCDEQLDALGDAAAESFAPGEFLAYNAQYERRLESLIPEIPLYERRNIDILTTKLQNFAPVPGLSWARVRDWRLQR